MTETGTDVGRNSGDSLDRLSGPSDLGHNLLVGEHGESCEEDEQEHKEVALGPCLDGTGERRKARTNEGGTRCESEPEEGEVSSRAVAEGNGEGAGEARR